MDFGKLSQAEKLATYGAVATIIGGAAGALGGLMWLAVLAAIAMLAVIFLPQFSPDTQLPGSRGSLMLICGGIAAVAAVLALLTFIGVLDFWFNFAPIRAILFLVGVAGAVLMGWAAWQAFQAEGGKFTVGTSSSGAAGRAETTSAPREDAGTPARDESTPAPREQAAAAPPPTESTTDAPPASPADEERDPPA
jgi:hypothetical protein